MDTRENLNTATSNQVAQLAQIATRFAGHMALRLVHDHLLQLDLSSYINNIRNSVNQINGKVKEIKRVSVQLPGPVPRVFVGVAFRSRPLRLSRLQLQPGLFPEALTVQWLNSAWGAYSRAARKMASDINNSNLDDVEMCRLINDRIMAVRPFRPSVRLCLTIADPDHVLLVSLQVERNFLSPYVSPRERPFRHILLGAGPHTLKGLSAHLDSIRTNDPKADADQFRNQFALATWTIQGCANALGGDF